MDLILDGVEQRLDVSDCANLAELIALAERSDRTPEASVVVAVEVDGEALPPEALASLERRPLAGIGRVAIERRPTRAVARSVLEQGATYTGAILAALDATVGSFRAGQSEPGNERLAELTDSLTVLAGISDSVSAVLEETSDALAAVQTELLPWLEALVAAQQQADPIGIADLLEYEIRARVEAWGKLMRSLSEGAGVGEPSEGKGPLSS